MKTTHAQYNWVGIPLSSGFLRSIGIVYCDFTYVGLHVLCTNTKGKGRWGYVQLESHTPVDVAYAIVDVCICVALHKLHELFNTTLFGMAITVTIGFVLSFVPQVISNVNYNWAVLCIIDLSLHLTVFLYIWPSFFTLDLSLHLTVFLYIRPSFFTLDLLSLHLTLVC